MTDRAQMTLVGLYGFGWLANWTYWIAVGWGIGEEIDHIGPILVGWFVALFWPLHAGFEIWTWALS